MFIVVSYDIVNDRRRTKIHKTMLNYGTRVQYSVFECDIGVETAKKMRDQLLRLIAPKEDSVRFYFLDEDAVKKIVTMGVGQVERAKPFYIIG
ncbi:MAG: CRISPR-associated endonuclease Cas2 [Chloroflexi bacterium]|nr:CRISPR-associated endonuclease Cas2 [Chloroflexota bacterium]